MSTTVFTLSELKRILLAAAGADDEADLDGDILDTDFGDLGYESLALLETAGRIERMYGISLDEAAFNEARTPRAMIDLVTAHLRANHAA
ncbi:acyl carrier protein [Streptomyces sp. NPDC052077]|uniref:acyl carrier protein n=1 Tax=Streptomyces sp. NPDC052077 TaxID=3154757 RepID=UPI00344279C8